MEYRLYILFQNCKQQLHLMFVNENFALLVNLDLFYICWTLHKVAPVRYSNFFFPRASLYLLLNGLNYILEYTEVNIGIQLLKVGVLYPLPFTMQSALFYM